MDFDTARKFGAETSLTTVSSAFLNLDQGSTKNSNIVLRRFGTLDTDWTYQQMFFKGGQLGFVFHHTEAVALEVVLRHVVIEFHRLLQRKWISEECVPRPDRPENHRGPRDTAAQGRITGGSAEGDECGEGKTERVLHLTPTPLVITSPSPTARPPGEK